MSMTRWFEFLRWAMLTAVMAWTASAVAQDAQNREEPPSSGSLSASTSDSVRELREQVRELQTAVAGMRSDWQRARAETEELRRELDEVRAGTGLRNAVVTDAVVKSEGTSAEAAVGSSQDSSQNVLQNTAQEDQEHDQKRGEHAASLEEEYQLLSGKVDDQYQTKVESASKYRIEGGWTTLIFPRWRARSRRAIPEVVSERPCDSRRSGSRRSGQAWRVRKQGQTCNSIWRAGFRRFPTGSTPDCCGCARARCAWTGQTRRLWSGRTGFSFHQTRLHHSLLWRFPRSPMQGTCGAGSRRYGWSTEWFWGKSRACCFREGFLIR